MIFIIWRESVVHAMFWDTYHHYKYLCKVPATGCLTVLIIAVQQSGRKPWRSVSWQNLNNVYEQSLMEFLYTSKIMDSPKNFTIMISIIVCILYQHLIMMICIWKLRFHLCQLQDFLNEKSLSMSKNAWYDWGLRFIELQFMVTSQPFPIFK